MDDTLRCYKILDLEPGASAERIRHSYVELSHVWDPLRYVDNVVLRQRAEQKRKEINEAYETLRQFLPELQNHGERIEKEARPERDFKELARETPVESTRAVLGIIVGISLIFIFAWAFYLVYKGRQVTPPSEPIAVSVE